MSKLFEASPTYKPFAFAPAVDQTVLHERVHWIEDEVSLTEDVTQWKLGEITPQEKHFVIQVLRLFTQGDVNVGQFYFDHLIPRAKNNEVRQMFASFACREGTHQRAYALINDTLGLPESEFHAFLAYKAMADKNDYMVQADASTDHGYMLALVKAICNEGIGLFASFAMLLHFQMHGKMRGMCKVVEWSQRDETLHANGHTYVFRSLAHDNPALVTDALKLAIYDMVRRTVELEDAFVDLAYEMGGVHGLHPEDVKKYVRYVANRRLTMLGLKENWEIATNPLPWVDWIVGGEDHTNFFEGKVTEYDTAGLMGGWGYEPAQEAATPVGYLLYTKADCPFCHKAAALLAAQAGDVAVHMVDMTDDTLRAQFYRENGFTGTRGPYAATMPKVYEVLAPEVPPDRIVLVGGYTELVTRLSAPEPTAEPAPESAAG